MATPLAQTPTEYNAHPNRRALVAQVPDALRDSYPGLADAPNTRAFAAAVGAFQRDHPPLVEDGKLGPRTARAMQAAARPTAKPAPGLPTSPSDPMFPPSPERTFYPDVYLWLAWAQFSKAQYKELADAGCKYFAVNFNDATDTGFKHNPGEKLLRSQIEDVIKVGGKVIQMPWIWWYPSFLKILAKELTQYTRDYAGHVVGWELNCEGSSRASAAHLARQNKTTPTAIVNEGMNILADVWPDDVEGSCSILHMNQEANTAVARHPKIRRLTVEAYSISRFTQPDLQPGEFQHKAFDAWDELLWDHDVDVIDIGLPNWDQEQRDKATTPHHLRQAPFEAARDMSDACLELYANPHIWAGGLADGVARTRAQKAEEKRNYARMIAEMRYLARGEGRFVIHDDARWNEPGVTPPDGFTTYRALGGHPDEMLGRLAGLVLRRNNPIGTRTPVEWNGGRFIACDALHTEIGRTGEKLPPGRTVHGVNIYPEKP